MTGAPVPEPPPGPGPEHGVERVELDVPLRPELRHLARMTAAVVASRSDFGIDQVEDLRLAIDELCITVAGEEGGRGRLHLSFEWGSGAVTVTATVVPDGVGAGPARSGARAVPLQPEAPALADLSARILDALVDEHGTDVVGGAPRAWLVMRRREDP